MAGLSVKPSCKLRTQMPPHHRISQPAQRLATLARQMTEGQALPLARPKARPVEKPTNPPKIINFFIAIGRTPLEQEVCQIHEQNSVRFPFVSRGGIVGRESIRRKPPKSRPERFARRSMTEC